MSLTKVNSVNKIEIVGDYNTVQVREVVQIIENGEVISENFHRYSINPGEDTSDKPAKVQAVVAAVHTQDVINDYTNYINSEE